MSELLSNKRFLLVSSLELLSIRIVICRCVLNRSEDFASQKFAQKKNG